MGSQRNCAKKMAFFLKKNYRKVPLDVSFHGENLQLAFNY
jgi:hypothetical protein